MVRILTYSLDIGISEDASLDSVPNCLKEREAVVWLDFKNPSDNDFQYLESSYRFHPLALEDARTKFNLPKNEFQKYA